MKELTTAMRKSGLLLAFFALVGVIFVSMSHLLTKDQIAENKRMMLQQKWNEVLDASRYANDLNLDNKILSPEEMDLPYNSTVYLARDKQNQPVAAIFRVTTLEGYSGAITMLVSVNYADQHLSGVRVVGHKETPGLGDKIEVSKGDWILGFNDKFLTEPTQKTWAVKRDGGDFDQFTGATITPRAVVALVEKVLMYSHNNMDKLFVEPIKPTNKEAK